MAQRGSRFGRALGGVEARRRRHRRVAVLVVVLLLIAGALVFVFGEDETDSGFVAEASAICNSYAARLLDELALSFPEGAPTAEAEAEYLSHAFADTLDEMIGELQALEPTGDAADAVATLAATSAALRVDPSIGVGTDPFVAEVRPAFDEAGLEACGSGFLTAPA